MYNLVNSTAQFMCYNTQGLLNLLYDHAHFRSHEVSHMNWPSLQAPTCTNIKYPTGSSKASLTIILASLTVHI